MRKKVGIIKRVSCISLVFLLSINSFAAIVSDNDGAAFITKAEFDALKNNFQSQIDSYNNSIDSKIDGAISSYLAGISLATQKEQTNYYDLVLGNYGRTNIYWNNDTTGTYGSRNTQYPSHVWTANCCVWAPDQPGNGSKLNESYFSFNIYRPYARFACPDTNNPANLYDYYWYDIKCTGTDSASWIYANWSGINAEIVSGWSARADSAEHFGYWNTLETWMDRASNVPQMVSWLNEEGFEVDLTNDIVWYPISTGNEYCVKKHENTDRCYWTRHTPEYPRDKTGSAVWDKNVPSTHYWGSYCARYNPIRLTDFTTEDVSGTIKGTWGVDNYGYSIVSQTGRTTYSRSITVLNQDNGSVAGKTDMVSDYNNWADWVASNIFTAIKHPKVKLKTLNTVHKKNTCINEGVVLCECTDEGELTVKFTCSGTGWVMMWVDTGTNNNLWGPNGRLTETGTQYQNTTNAVTGGTQVERKFTVEKGKIIRFVYVPNVTGNKTITFEPIILTIAK